MKIGRNDPCPCGSGKKYKKCCLSKNSCMLNEKSFLSTFQSSYDYTKDISKELYKRINKYAIDDIRLFFNNDMRFLSQFKGK